MGTKERAADLRIIVIDNGGGGIFSFLTPATTLAPEHFELLFGTPHHTDIVALAQSHGVHATTVSSVEALISAVTSSGPSVTRVVTDRADNVTTHATLNRAVHVALNPHIP